MKGTGIALGLILVCSIAIGARDLLAQTPTVYDSNLEIDLISEYPEIQSPIGVAADRKGRLFVVEAFTHFPRAGSNLPKSDRIKLFRDSNEDSRFDEISIFASGFTNAMNIAFSPDGQLFLTTRNSIVSLRDYDDNGQSDEVRTILQMETSCTYPHNGIGAITFGDDGALYFGKGENLGAKYLIRGSDESNYGGEGDGGGIFRCRADGSDLEIVAQGLWNPFGLCWFGKHYLLATDNDPDGPLTNRLLDVVEGGDYGFRYRYGRSGKHPYQAWNGEIPGTLPMISSIGEAATAILNGDTTNWPASYRQAVLVASAWENEIELLRPSSRGASLQAERRILVKGDSFFRPSGMAAAPDGSVYISDWASPSYSNGFRGRIWRLRLKSGVPSAAHTPYNPALSTERSRLVELTHSTSFPELFQAAKSSDPFFSSAAIHRLAGEKFQDTLLTFLSSASAQERLVALLALRRLRSQRAEEFLPTLIRDSDDSVRSIALIWVGERKLRKLKKAVAHAKPASDSSLRLREIWLATAKLLGEG